MLKQCYQCENLRQIGHMTNVVPDFRPVCNQPGALLMTDFSISSPIVAHIDFCYTQWKAFMVCISIIRMPLLVFVTLSAVHIAAPCNEAHCNCNCFIHSLVFSLEGRAWQEPEPSHVTGMALAHCILGKYLGVVCHCFPPPLDFPTLAARCLRPQRRERS